MEGKGEGGTVEGFEGVDTFQTALRCEQAVHGSHPAIKSFPPHPASALSSEPFVLLLLHIMEWHFPCADHKRLPALVIARCSPWDLHHSLRGTLTYHIPSHHIFVNPSILSDLLTDQRIITPSLPSPTHPSHIHHVSKGKQT